VRISERTVLSGSRRFVDDEVHEMTPKILRVSILAADTKCLALSVLLFGARGNNEPTAV
jgi:hypothetical protein